MKSPRANARAKAIRASGILTLDKFSIKLDLKISLNVVIKNSSFLNIHAANGIFRKCLCPTAGNLHSIPNHVGEKRVPFDLQNGGGIPGGNGNTLWI